MNDLQEFSGSIGEDLLMDDKRSLDRLSIYMILRGEDLDDWMSFRFLLEIFDGVGKLIEDENFVF